MEKNFDAIVAGAGIWGCTVARRLAEAGKRVLVLEKRKAVGGNCRCEIDPETGIEVHTYGSHIFHTSNEEVWKFVRRFTEFNDYRHCVLAKTKKVGGESRWTAEFFDSGRAASMRPPRGDESGALGDRALPAGVDRRAMAEKKVEEWLAGVDEATFDAALVKLVEEKTAAGEYRFKKSGERELALEGARKFYREFSRKIVPLSDGRYVYFAPDERAKIRNANNAISWAEYAFHAVSSSGKLLDGKNFRERLYNQTKATDLPFLEGIVREEHCMYRLIDAYPENDAVIFVGRDGDGGRLEVITRLDQFGNAEANLGEVTVIAKHKRKEFPPPKFRPLTEVVETVAKHQAAGFSPSTTVNNIANCPPKRKGGAGAAGELESWKVGKLESWGRNNGFSGLNGLRSDAEGYYLYHLPIGKTLLEEFFGLPMADKNLREFLATSQTSQTSPSSQTSQTYGSAIFDAFIRGYTSKQWGVPPEKMDPSVIARLKVRDSYSTDYFDDPHQGIPSEGYNKMFERMLDHPNITIETEMTVKMVGTDLRAVRNPDSTQSALEIDCGAAGVRALPIYYSGPIDALFNYKYGALPWRTLRFERETLPVADYQGNAVVNYTDADVPFTRIHEFAHYHPESNGVLTTTIPNSSFQVPNSPRSSTVIMREYSATWRPGDEPYYPIATPESAALLARYQSEVDRLNSSLFTLHFSLVLGGRLGQYKYFDMDKSIAAALAVEI